MKTKIDFNKYNKNLRFYSTIIKINPRVFTSNKFNNIISKDNEIIIEYNSYPGYYFHKILEDNSYYFNNYIVDNKFCYKFLLNSKEDISILNDINILGSKMLTNIFLVEMCILWKDYLDNEFISYICKTNQTRKGED